MHFYDRVKRAIFLSCNARIKMAKLLKKVTPEDLKTQLDSLMEAAAQGNLYVAVNDSELSTTDVMPKVKQYVAQVDELATPQWRSKISALWSQILSDPDFQKMLMPKSKSRKCRDFDKYSVMRIMGILIVHNVYPEESKQVDFCRALEHFDKSDCSYRSYLGQGIEDRELRKRLVEYIEHAGENRQAT